MTLDLNLTPLSWTLIPKAQVDYSVPEGRRDTALERRVWRFLCCTLVFTRFLTLEAGTMPEPEPAPRPRSRRGR